MAKKKVTPQPQQEQPPQDQNFNQTRPLSPPPSSMEESRDKVENLKSLNSLLLKETIERRQQVESLVQAKKELESELTRSSLKKVELESDLTRSGDDGVCLEIQKCMFLVFIETQMGEMGVGVEKLMGEMSAKKSEIEALKSEVGVLALSLESEKERLSKACTDRDSLKRDSDRLVKEASDLSERVIEMEKKEKKFEKEIAELRAQYVAVVKDVKQKESEIVELKIQRDSVEVNLIERVKEIAELKRGNEEIAKEKNEIEVEMSIEKAKVVELNKELIEVKESLSNNYKEEKVLRGKILNLEKNYSEALEKEKAKTMELKSLMEEKKEKDKEIERLREEKDSMDNLIKGINAQMEDKDMLIEKLTRERNEIEEVKVGREREVAELYKELVELRDVVFAMKQSTKDLEDKNTKLLSELGDYRNSLELTRVERDDAREDLDKEKKNVWSLTSKVRELEKRIEVSNEEFSKVKNEHENLIKHKKEMEKQFDLLSKEKDEAKKNLSGAQKEVDNLRLKMETTNNNMDRTLSMLKDTAVMVWETCDGKERAIANEKKLDGEIEPYAVELETIKSAFKQKESMVEELKHQVEVLQDSAEAANQEKKFWSIVSRVTSATTVFAAVVLAYVARVR